MSVAVTIELNGVRVPLVLDDSALRSIAEALPRAEPADESSPYVSVLEAATYLRCSRQRIYDLLSQRQLTRHKDGARVLIRRTEIAAYLERTSRQ